MYELLDTGMSIMNNIGFFGPIVLLGISIIKLRTQQPYLVSYLLFFIVNTVVNKILKFIIKQPRPTNGVSIINESYEGADKYGMPSAHAQSVFYSMSFLYLVKEDYLVLLIESLVSFLTLYQRWSYKRHTIEQLGVGSMIGMLVAYIGIYVTKQYLQ